jgi:hypothetical protein
MDESGRLTTLWADAATVADLFQEPATRAD